MAYLLGLRNGDELIEVNGYSLAGPVEAYFAYLALWVDQGETEYTLTVQRSTSFVYLNYEIFLTAP